MTVSRMSAPLNGNDKWLIGHRTIPARHDDLPAGNAPDTSLVCFPPAGCGATTFAGWRRFLPADVELLAVQLPGRESRFDEPPIVSSAEVAECLAPRIIARAARRLVLFGHSLGALLAFEVACRLRGPDEPAPTLLIVSGSRAPHLPSRMAGIVSCSDADLVRELRRFGCDPAGALSDPEVAGLFLTPLRADLAMATDFGYQERSTPLGAPILALSGCCDLTCDCDDVEAWAGYTTAGFTHRRFDGGHFFVREHEAEVVAAVFAEIRARTTRATSGGRC